MKNIFPVLQYINIPNLITTLGVCLGIGAYFHLTRDNLSGVLIFLAFASLMDLVDGFFAVRLNKQTQFGKYADSYADFFICCVMPVFIAYRFVGNSPLIIISSAFYCICGLWRLAHFTVTSTGKPAHFTGLPVPGAMLLVMITVWCVAQYNFPVWPVAVVFAAAALFMISSIKIKKYGIGQKAMCILWLGFFLLVVLS
jgi:CDP-diacylglycerol--serine O-phosphatidyltransferase